MMNRAAILFSDFGPYHIARIDALGEILKNDGIELIAFRISQSSSTYSWKPLNPKDVKVVTLSNKKPKGILSNLLIALKFRRELKKLKVGYVFLPSYSPLTNYACYQVAKQLNCKLIMMNESWALTSRSRGLSNFIKRKAINGFDSALVGGSPQVDYLVSYGFNENKVFTGYDIVDNEFFRKEANRWKIVANEQFPIKGIPERFFLNIGRFVTKKNLEQLVVAYCNLMKKYPSQEISLVLVGEGDQEVKLAEIAKSKGVFVRDGASDLKVRKQEVVFYPFQQISTTPLFFAKCECFILPSMYEEWGLVINEALASGAPVLVSQNVGSSFDLVKEGVNGFKFDPTDVKSLESLLALFLNDSSLKAKLSIEAFNSIKDWGPSKFAEGGAKALANA